MKINRSRVMGGAAILIIAGTLIVMLYIMIFSVFVILALSSKAKPISVDWSWSLIFSILMLPIPGILGYFALQRGFRYIRIAKKVKKYIPLIVNENISAIDTIAQKLNLGLSRAVEDIEFLINTGFLPGYVIDRSHWLVSRPINNIKIADVNLQQYVSFQCRACGANNSLPSGSISCEYCDVAHK